MRRHRQAMSNIAKEQRAKVAAEKAAAKAAAREIGKQRAASDRFRRGIAGRAVGAAGGAIGGVGRLAAGGAALLGGFAVQDAVREQIRVTSAATGLANQAFGNAGEKRTREQIRTDVMKQVGDLDRQSGMGRENLIGGLRSFTAISGDLGGGQKLLGFMAELADAVDANVEDIGQATARVKQAVEAGGATGELAAKQTEQIMSVIAGQSKVGSVELKDLASMIGRVTSAAGKFSGGAPKLIAEMGAMAQLAVEGGAMGGAEATTATSRLPTDIIKHQKALKKMGVDIFTDKSKTAIRGPTDIIKDVLTKSGGDLTKITPIFGDESKKIFDPLAKAYKEAGGGEAGLKAIDAKLKPFLAAGLSETDRKSSAEFARNTPERQFAKGMGELKEAIGSQLLPELTKLAPAMAKLVPYVTQATQAFVQFVQWVKDNPIKGIGAIIAAKIGLDLASTGITTAATKGIEAALRRMSIGGSGGGSGGVPPVGGGVVVAGAAAAAGVALAVDQASKLQKETGTKGSLADILPGFKNGDFSFDQLMGESLGGPSSYWKKGANAVGTLGESLDFDLQDKRANVAAKERALQESAAAGAKIKQEQEAATNLSALNVAAKDAAAELSKLGAGAKRPTGI